MSMRAINISKKKKYNFEDDDVTPCQHEEVPIKFDYPFKNRKSKDRKKDQAKEEIDEKPFLPAPVFEAATSLCDSTQIENQRLSVII